MKKEEVEALGYKPAKLLSTGEWAGIMGMLFTTGLFVGINEYCWRTRFCFEDRKSAEESLEAWDGEGDPPGPWIKQKGGAERSNPNLSSSKAHR